MIFVMAGTQDGRELVKVLLAEGYEVTASVVSSYGRQLLEENHGSSLVINDEPLDGEALENYFRSHRIKACVDASHPYAINASRNAMTACRGAGVPYLRYERDLTQLDYDKAVIVHSYEEAAEEAAKLGKVIFLTTGSRNLSKFTVSPHLQECRLIARVLPTAEVIGLCEELGLAPDQIVALQGPFSAALNRELFLRYGAEVIVTKNSGTLGGTDTKLQAAAELGLPLIVIDRPPLAYDCLCSTFEELKENLQNLLKEDA